ncbi:MAG: tyrosine-type recombinase/integrase [Candidatus Sedimenticola sp. (ex Thyasira tokunagai)]
MTTTLPPGVEIHGKQIRVYFPYDGDKCREPVPGDPTDSEAIKYAGNLVASVRHEIRAGAFDYAKYFPNSKRLKENRLEHYLDIWLDIKKNQTADSTYKGYAGIVERYIRPKWGLRQANQIDYIDIEHWISDELSPLASKTIKETIALLSQTYQLYQKRNPGAHNPTQGVKVRLPDRPDPEVWTREEIDTILSTPAHGGHVQELNLITFMLWAGPRVSEAIALAWEDVDLDAGVIYFKRARVRGPFKATKTRRSTREVELLQPALDALRDQYNRTAGQDPVTIEVTERDNRTIRTEKVRFVFHNSNTGQVHNSDSTLRDSFFKSQLKDAEVRYLGPGQCRHTFASQMLSAEMPLEWIAKQMGHASTAMLHKHYSKWIKADAYDMVARANERLKL